MIEIQEIREDWQAAEAEKLAWEFVDWLRGRYPEMQTEIDDYLAGQKFAERMKDVRKDYGPPRGEGLLALLDGKPVGLLLMRDIGDHACEMNRMFVRPEARGKGVARQLADQLIETARVKGFEWMRLGALPRHDEALALYRSLGFREDKGQTLDGDTKSAVKMSLYLGRHAH